MNDFKKVVRAMRKYERELEKNMRPALKQSMEDVKEKASSPGFHRYKSRSGMLNKAYEMIIKSPLEGVLKLTKRESNTPYAWAIHSGRDDWSSYKPDLFLYRAAKHRGVRKQVRDNFLKAINKSRKVFNGIL